MLRHIKASIAFASLVGFITAGVVHADTSSNCPAPTPASNEALANHWVQVILSTNVDIEDLLTNDYVHNAGYARPVIEGRETYLKYRNEFFTGGTFTDWKPTADQIITTNDRVVVSWTVNAVYQQGQGGSVEAGTPVTWTGMTIIRPECGKVAEAWVEADSLAWLQQIGAVPR